MKSNPRIEEIYKRGLESLEAFYQERKPRGRKKKEEPVEEPQSKEYDTVNEQEI